VDFELQRIDAAGDPAWQVRIVGFELAWLRAAGDVLKVRGVTVTAYLPMSIETSSTIISRRKLRSSIWT
jgi:hypothetical protein